MVERLDGLSKPPENKDSNVTSSSTLSIRRQQVLQLRARGMKTKEIAQALHITGQSVRNHNTDIDNKLDEDRKTDSHRALRSVLIGVEKGIINPDLVLKDVGLDVSFIGRLTPRQKEIIKCMHENRSISRKLVAGLLFITSSSVRNLVGSIRMLAWTKAGKEINIIPIVIAYGEAQKQGKV